MLSFRFANDASSHSERGETHRLFAACPLGRVAYTEWPAEKKAIDIGSFYADSSKFKRATGWAPTVKLRDGLCQTLAFYRRYFPQYVDASPTRESA